MSAVISTPKAPAAIGPYVQAQAVNGLIFTSGQLGFDKNGALPADFESQAKNALENVKAILEAGGSSLAKVVKVLIFLKDMNNFAALNSIYGTYFKEPCPARSCVEVARLPRDGMVEIEVIAES
jgi:2-iminobutanoate/2-iminopropanoate deaminase